MISDRDVVQAAGSHPQREEMSAQYLVAERMGALPDAPMAMPAQVLEWRGHAARPAIWMRLRMALTARAGH